MHRVYLGLGSNLGDRKAHLDLAMCAIEENVGRICARSSYYETEPWGVSAQEPYLNVVLEISTAVFPLTLLKMTQAMELDGGRERSLRWGSRTIDIDILFYGDIVAHFQDLIIPHPRIVERNFVLTPLAEIAADLLHPQTKQNISTLMNECSDQTWIKKCAY